MISVIYASSTALCRTRVYMYIYTAVLSVYGTMFVHAPHLCTCSPHLIQKSFLFVFVQSHENINSSIRVILSFSTICGFVLKPLPESMEWQIFCLVSKLIIPV